MACAWTGDIQAAIDRLNYLANIPGGPDYGQLRFDPAWSAARSDPRFSDIVHRLQPH